MGLIKRVTTVTDYIEEVPKRPDYSILFMLILWGIYMLFRIIWGIGYNTFNFGTISDFGFPFYKNNIITMNAPSYIITERNKYIYHTIPKMSDLEDTNNIILTVKKNQILKNHGYITQNSSSWLAVSFYLEDEKRTGYMYIPYKIGYDILEINSVTNQFMGKDAKTYKDRIENLERTQKTAHTSEII